MTDIILSHHIIFYSSRKTDSLWFQFRFDLLILSLPSLHSLNRVLPIISLCENYFMAAISGSIFISIRNSTIAGLSLAQRDA
jgi:hypothetical protein